jgi:hypothetical protein
VINGKIGFSIVLIARNGTARHRFKYAIANRRKARAFRRARDIIVDKPAVHSTFPVIVPEVECAVFADHSINRPHARNMIAPPGGTAGNRYHEKSGVV